MFIEDRFGKNSPTKVPEEIKDLGMKGEAHLQTIQERIFRWWNFIEYQYADMYIQVVKKGFDSYFKEKYPHEKIGETPYKKFLLECFESLAIACEVVNVELAHLMSRRVPKLGSLDFDPAIDDKVTVFYNSLLGTNIEETTTDIKKRITSQTQMWSTSGVYVPTENGKKGKKGKKGGKGK